MSGHTSGPWKVDVNHGQYSVRRAANGEVIARIARWDPEIDKADAHLMAASLDLLAALRDVLEYMPTQTAYQRERARLAHAAIAKAEGDTK